MAYALPHPATFPRAAARPRGSGNVLSEQFEHAILAAIRVGLVLLASYVGTLFVRSVTHTLCIATQQPPPAWSTGSTPQPAPRFAMPRA